ncbi:MAG: plasmid mobilization protein, partial [Bacteroidales bacterium]
MEEANKKKSNGRPVKAIKKDKLIAFRLSQAEFNDFEKRFKSSNLDSKSLYIKKCIFGKQINAPEMPLITYYNSIAEIAKELNKSGNNINQITKKINTMNLSEKELRLVSYELNRIMEELIF